MKNIIVILGLVVSFVMLAGCASHQCKECNNNPAPVVHHDYKGEVSK